MPALGILELLALRGFDRTSRFKFVRHQDQRLDLQEIMRRGWFELYQSFQSKPKFDHCDYIISFSGMDGSRAKLHGVYRVGKRGPSLSMPFPADCPYTDWHQAGYHYELTRVPGYEDLCGRVVIEWGAAPIVWVQSGPKDKVVFEILPQGQTLQVFKDYLDFTLTFDELCLLVNHHEHNADWRARLQAVAGIYLIVAATTGKQYVGSAYGAGGIWGRWVDYATAGHGGNVHLKRLIAEDSAYPKAFRFSLLQIVPRTYSRQEVLRLEKRYKDKLGRLAVDLNGN